MPSSTANRARARRALARAESAVAKAKARRSAARRRVPAEPVGDPVLHGWDGKPLPLSRAFGAKRDLLVVHNMGTTCPYCTMWADGFDGLRLHLQDRAALLVVSPDPVRRQKAFARSRGWRFPMASAHGTSFFRDLGFSSADGSPWPGVSAFHKDARGRITRVARAEFGPGDDFNPVFPLFDLLRGGAGAWGAKFRYPRAGRRAR